MKALGLIFIVSAVFLQIWKRKQPTTASVQQPPQQ